VLDGNVPAWDDLLGTSFKGEWLVALFAGIEDGSVSEGTDVVNKDKLAFNDVGAFTFFDNVDFELMVGWGLLFFDSLGFFGGLGLLCGLSSSSESLLLGLKFLTLESSLGLSELTCLLGLSLKTGDLSLSFLFLHADFLGLGGGSGSLCLCECGLLSKSGFFGQSSLFSCNSGFFGKSSFLGELSFLSKLGLGCESGLF
jgi:hypothetical protein